MSQSHLRLKQRGMEQNKDVTVATPEEFVRHFGGNRVINRVNLFSIIYFSFYLNSYFPPNCVGFNCQQWNSSCKVHAIHPAMGL